MTDVLSLSFLFDVRTSTRYQANQTDGFKSDRSVVGLVGFSLFQRIVFIDGADA